MAGKRLSESEFLAVIKGVNATDVHIEISKVATHASGDVAYLLYDARPSLESGAIDDRDGDG